MSSTSVLKDLRNRSFKGQNLKGADFAHCDLRGVDFSKAQLQGASFLGSTFGQTAQQRTKLIAFSLAFSLALTVFYVGSFSFSFALAVVLAVAVTLAVSVTFSVAFFFSVFFAFAFAFGGAFSAIGAFLAFGRGDFLEGIIHTTIAFFLFFVVGFAGRFFPDAIDAIKKAPGTRFENADLTGATFDNAVLTNCSFTGAILTQVNWTGTVFQHCNFEPNQQMKLLIHRNGNGGNYSNLNFSDTHMVAIQLIKADLTNSNLSNANLQHADLLNATLVNLKANGADFSHATLTGACIYNWKIDLKTQFTDVICDYVYLKLDDEGNKIDRRPSSGVFQPGEFAELVHKFTNTLDILFPNDINLTAFALALEPLQNHGDLELSGVENLAIGQLYRFKAPDNFPKEQAHAEFWQIYEDTQIKLKATEDRILYLQETNQNLTTQLTDAEKFLIKARDKHKNFLQELVFRQVDRFSRPTLNADGSQSTGD